MATIPTSELGEESAGNSARQVHAVSYVYYFVSTIIQQMRLSWRGRSSVSIYPFNTD